MHRHQQLSTKQPEYRPAGASDQDSDDCDEDGFELSGFSRNRNRNVPIQNRTQVDYYGEADWGREGVDVPPAPLPLSNSEMARIACCKGDIDKLAELLQSGEVTANSAFPDDYTPLITAAAHGQPKLVKYLLEQGADANRSTKAMMTTPLIAAVSCPLEVAEDDVLECVKLLVEAGCDVNKQDRQAATALLLAIKNKERRRKVAEYLLEHGADVDTSDLNGRTCLFHAAEAGDGKACRLLLEKGANVNVIDDQGWSAYDSATDKGFHSLGQLLYLVRTTKWRPGQDPTLMQQELDSVPKGRHLTAEGTSILEDSQIDMVLNAIQAEKYMENFRKHRITYLQFLQFDNNDLKEVGVDEVGVRKAILQSIQAVHTTDWSKNSIRMVPVNKKNTASETICIINNVNNHIQHINATLGYLKKRILKEPKQLQFGKELHNIKEIIYRLKQLDKINFALEKTTLELLDVIEQMSENEELQLADDYSLSAEDVEDFMRRWNALKQKEESKFTLSTKGLVITGILTIFFTSLGGYYLRARV